MSFQQAPQASKWFARHPMWQLNWLEPLPWSSWQWRTLALKSFYNRSCYALCGLIPQLWISQILRNSQWQSWDPSWTKGCCQGFCNSIDKICWIGFCSTLEAQVFDQMCHHPTLLPAALIKAVFYIFSGLALVSALAFQVILLQWSHLKSQNLTQKSQKNSEIVTCAMIIHDSCCRFWCLEHRNCHCGVYFFLWFVYPAFCSVSMWDVTEVLAAETNSTTPSGSLCAKASW